MIPKRASTPAECLEVWGWISWNGRIPKVLSRHHRGENEDGIDQGAIMARWTERFMLDQPYRPVVQAYIVDVAYPWRGPGETKLRALMRHGLAFLLEHPDPEVPARCHGYSLAQLTDWSRDNPPPEFSKNFEVA